MVWSRQLTASTQKDYWLCNSHGIYLLSQCNFDVLQRSFVNWSIFYLYFYMHTPYRCQSVTHSCTFVAWILIKYQYHYQYNCFTSQWSHFTKFYLLKLLLRINKCCLYGDKILIDILSVCNRYFAKYWQKCLSKNSKRRTQDHCLHKLWTHSGKRSTFLIADNVAALTTLWWVMWRGYSWH